jgi:hypothetical protein
MNISEINIYPVKSLRGIALDEAVVEKRGLRNDRRWMLTDRNGYFFTQRELPHMAAIRISLNRRGLVASAPGVENLRMPQHPEVKLRQHVTIWQSEVEAHVYDRHVNEWFSEVLKRECRLVLMPDTTERHVNTRFDRGADIVSFADGYPLLLIGEGSLEEVNRRIEASKDALAGKVPAFHSIPMNRFRPNLVVRGSEAFAEDGWARIRVGEAKFRVVKPCARCVITTVDQAKGEFDGKEPLATMASFRLAKQVFPETYESYGQTANGVLFGENLIPENPGVAIRVGDEVEVLEYRPEVR